MQHALMFRDFPEQSFRETAAVPLQVCRTADFVTRAKTAALPRNFVRRPFSAAVKETPNGEIPPLLAAVS
jgi:hypothetical protein